MDRYPYYFACFLKLHVGCFLSLGRVLSWLLLVGLIVQAASLPAFGQSDASDCQCQGATTIIVNNPLRPRHRVKLPPAPLSPMIHSTGLSVSVDLHEEPRKVIPKTDWVARFWKGLPVAGLLLLLGYGLSEWWFPARPREKKPVWFVWSIRDEVGAGAAGAVMEALDVRVNPLVAPYIQLDYKRREEARARRELLLLPPFLEYSGFKDDSIFRGGSTRSNEVLKDFLGSGFPLTFVEEIVFFPDENNITEGAKSNHLPEFRLDEAYGEVNLKVGSFELRGIMGLVTLYKRVRYRRFHNVLGFVSKAEGKGWAVRLNGQIPAETARDESKFVASVWADTIDTDFGDPLGLVAQRAAFKLLLRIVDDSVWRETGGRRPRYDTNSIHAIANFRQGIDQLLQLL